MWAVIGGTGFEKISQFQVISESAQVTPFGNCSSNLQKINFNGLEFIFLARHGKHHELLPSEINYCANIFALKKAGVNKILALSAVGSLKTELKPGEIVVPTQYINQTQSIRRNTFLGNGVIGHVSLADPVSKELAAILGQKTGLFNFHFHFNKTYICIEGPHFSTRAESRYFRLIGGDVIGMTAYPEYALAKEANMSYLPCCFITDYDSWDENKTPVTLTAVLENMKKYQLKAVEIVRELLPETKYFLPKTDPDTKLDRSIQTYCPCSAHQKAWLDVLLKD